MKERLVRFRSFWVFPLLGVVLVSLTARGRPGSVLVNVLPFLLIGIVAWTLLEYGFHRILLHAEFRSPIMQKFINASHLRHHAAPRDPDQILVQLSFALVISAVLYGAILIATRDAFVTSGVMSGVWLGFLYYEAVHYRVHLSLAHSALLQQQRRAHFYHHFSDSGKCFGVTSPLWDYVFGTMRRRSVS